MAWWMGSELLRAILPHDWTQIKREISLQSPSLVPLLHRSATNHVHTHRQTFDGKPYQTRSTVKCSTSHMLVLRVVGDVRLQTSAIEGDHRSPPGRHVSTLPFRRAHSQQPTGQLAKEDGSGLLRHQALELGSVQNKENQAERSFHSCAKKWGFVLFLQKPEKSN